MTAIPNIEQPDEPADNEEQAKLLSWKKKKQERQQRRQQQQQGEGEGEGEVVLEDFAAAINNNDNSNSKEEEEEQEEADVVPWHKRRRLEQDALLQQDSLKHRRRLLQSHNDRGGDNINNNNNNNNNNNDDDDDDAQGATTATTTQAEGANDATTTTTTTNTNTTQQQNQENAAGGAGGAAGAGGAGNDDLANGLVVESLLEQAQKVQQSLTAEQRVQQQRNEEEARILKEASKVQTNALQAASDIAKGLLYKESLPTTWTPPSYILNQKVEGWNQIRKEWHMEVEGENIPPPCKRFVDMRFPAPILAVLQRKGIKRPTPIQMQGLTVALASRDMIGIAFTGSGKTLTFSLPLVMAALEEELRLPLVAGEGPIGIILAPSRELARQTYDTLHEYCQEISQTEGYPELRTQLLIGGESVREQIQVLQSFGIHCVVATPGRLRDVLKRKTMKLDNCRYICLDEADRMLDLGFDEEVGEIMNYFPHQKQTLLFSATFPKKFQDFARETLVRPIVVNVGRAGAANLDVIQEVEYVKQEAKIVYLLHCLQKTAPPVIIFCERKGDVDDIHEYLLLKGVEAVSIHGGKDQVERNEAIIMYKDGKKDVLVATDIAAKGLDFSDIQHVINFDMPNEIENYVHRIGRTGRCGKTGVATTYINKSCDETTLLDLKHLLKEARQRIPPVLLMLDDPLENAENNGGGGVGANAGGCSYCGGLGHSVLDCPKIDKNARQMASGKKDALASNGGYGGEW